MSKVTDSAAPNAVLAFSRNSPNSGGGVFAAFSRLFFRAPMLAKVFSAPSIPFSSADSR